MSTLQLSGCRTTSLSTSFCERTLFSVNGAPNHLNVGLGRTSSKVPYGKKRFVTIFAMSNNSNSNFKMNLNEYMVTLEKPLGIRFALCVDGRIIVHSLRKGSNAERSRIIMVGDTLNKASLSSGGRFTELNDVSDMQKMLTEKTGSFSLVLERPFSPFPIQQLHLSSDLDVLFNKGRMPVATWNKALLASNLKMSSEGCVNIGFVVFSAKFLTSKGWKLLDNQNGHVQSLSDQNVLSSPVNQIVCVFSEEESGEGEWTHGSFPLEEYIKALDRSKGELYYNHSLGMRYHKITEQIYVGSCIQNEADVETLSNATSKTNNTGANQNFSGKLYLPPMVILFFQPSAEAVISLS